jgi:hypothetical protein
VALVHEGEDRDAAAAADLEQLARLRLDALGGVDDHERRIDRGEHAVGVLGEVLVARRVEQIDGEAVVVELQDGRADAKMPRCFSSSIQSEAVAALVLTVLDRAGEVDGAAVAGGASPSASSCRRQGAR